MRPAADTPQHHGSVNCPGNNRPAVGPTLNLDRSAGELLLLTGHSRHAGAVCGTGTRLHVTSFLNQPQPSP